MKKWIALLLFFILSPFLTYASGAGVVLTGVTSISPDTIDITWEYTDPDPDEFRVYVSATEAGFTFGTYSTAATVIGSARAAYGVPVPCGYWYMVVAYTDGQQQVTVTAATQNVCE